MTSFEKFFNLLATPIYCLLCIYTSLFCACTAVEPISDFFSKNLNTFYRSWLNGGESSIFGYLTAVVIGIVALITLVIIYRERREKYIPVLLTFLPVIFTALTITKHFYIQTDPAYSVLRYIYIIIVPVAFADAVLTLAVFIKSFRDQQQQPEIE